MEVVATEPQSHDPVLLEPSGVAEQLVDTTVARSIEAVEALRPHFDRVPAVDIDSDLDFFLTVNRHRQSPISPHVILLQLDDGREIRVVARLAERRSGFRVSRLKVLQVTFGGVVGAETESEFQLVVQSLRHLLSEGEADMLILPHLEVEGGLYKAARACAERWQPDLTGRSVVHWRADLPSSFEAFLASRSSKTRSNIRYYSKKLLEAHGDDLEVRAFHDRHCLAVLHQDIEYVAARTYQRGLGVGYTGDALQAALMDLAASRGSLRAWVLYIANTPAAFWFGYCYRDTFWSIANAFDPVFSDLRIGQYLQMEVMRALCAEADIRVFDWGTGSAEYKQRFGDRVTVEADVVLLRPSLRGREIAAVIKMRTGVKGAMQSVVARTRLGARARRTWRKLAQRRARIATSA